MRRNPRHGFVQSTAQLLPLTGGLFLGIVLTFMLPHGPSQIQNVSITQMTTWKADRVDSWSRGVTFSYVASAGRAAPDPETLLRGVQQLRKASPSIAVAVVVSDTGPPMPPTVAALFDRVVVLPAETFKQWSTPIAALLASPWQRTLYLPLGIQVCHPIDVMFDWLDHYDLGAVLEPLPSRQTMLHAEGGPSLSWQSLNKYNPDVLLFDHNSHTTAFFNQWNEALLDSPKMDRSVVFATTLLRAGDLRVKQLPAEFNLVMTPANLPIYLTGAVRLLNTRKETCDRVNGITLPRLYDSESGLVLYKWELSKERPESSPLLSRCIAKEGTTAPNTRVHQAVVPDQLDVPE